MTEEIDWCVVAGSRLNHIHELEHTLKTAAEAHHTALEVERAKVRELEAQRDKYQDDLQINVDAGRRIIAKLKVDVDLWKHAADQAALILKIAGAPDFQDAVHAREWARSVAGSHPGKVRELEAKLAEAQLPTVEHIQDIYELTSLKAQLAQMTEIRDSLLVERQHMIVGSEYKRVCEQLAQAQAACAEAHLLLGPDYPPNLSQDWDGWHKRPHEFLTTSKQEGWLSPDEAAKLQEARNVWLTRAADTATEMNHWRTRAQHAEAQCAAMRRLLSAPGCINSNCDGKGWYSVIRPDQHGEPEEQQEQCQWCAERTEALTTTAGQGLLVRLERYEKALNRIYTFPVHSEPVGGAYAMQDIAYEALKGGEK